MMSAEKGCRAMGSIVNGSEYSISFKVLYFGPKSYLHFVLSLVLIFSNKFDS